jgi:hypothetical protein
MVGDLGWYVVKVHVVRECGVWPGCDEGGGL